MAPLTIAAVRMARGGIGMSLEVKEGAARGKQMIDHLSILAGNPGWRVMIQAEQTRRRAWEGEKKQTRAEAQNGISRMGASIRLGRQTYPFLRPADGRR